jgi:2-polyprenyl-6-methoxyphenol hydroxylase-like FAD-dependent oxidoreductase
MIDLYGSGFIVAEKMGLLDQLLERRYAIPNLDFVDRRGRVQATYKINKFRELLKYRHFNFMRGDLEDVLHRCVQNEVPIRFQCSITGLQQQADQVEVVLSDGTHQSYDLVIGADGIHSNIRELAWGPEDQFSHFLGYYVACSVLNNFLADEDTFYTHLEPSRQASVYPPRNNQLATFMIFRSEKLGPLTHDQRLNLLDQVFQSVGWIVPELLPRLREAPAIYFDPVTQIKLDGWYKNRVALVGDACQCLTLLAGQGASMAMAGAYILASELKKAEGDNRVAFQAYQDHMMPEVRERQQKAEKLAGSFVPKNRLAIWVTILFLKLSFLPGFRSLLVSQVGAKSIIK